MHRTLDAALSSLVPSALSTLRDQRPSDVLPDVTEV